MINTSRREKAHGRFGKIAGKSSPGRARGTG